MDPTYKGLSVPTPTPKNAGPGLNIRRGLLLGGGLLGLVVVASLVVNMFSGGTTTMSQQLLFRLDALSSLMQSAASTIKDNNLSKINAEASLVLAGDTAATKKLIPSVPLTKELTAIKTAETDAATLQKLKDASVNGIYDMTYTTVLTEKLGRAYALTKELGVKTSQTKLQNALRTLADHLQIYYTQLKKLP